MSQKNLANKKLLLIGPSTGSVHLENYYNLIKGEFKEILVVTTTKIDYARYEVVDFSLRNPLKFLKGKRKLAK